MKTHRLGRAAGLATLVAIGCALPLVPRADSAECGPELDRLKARMERLGVRPGGVAPVYPPSPDMRRRDAVSSLYRAAVSLDHLDEGEHCLELVADARSKLDSMSVPGASAPIPAPFLTPSVSADALTGARVDTSDGETLGEIDRLLLDLEEGALEYAVISVQGTLLGGTLGLGEKLFPIPWRAFEVTEDGRGFVLDVDAQALREAPGFDQIRWPNADDPEWREQVNEFYERVSKG